MLKPSLMWPICLVASIAVHAAFLLSVGVKNSRPVAASANAFSVVDFSPAPSALTLSEKTSSPVVGPVDIAAASAKTNREGDKSGAIQSEEKVLSFEQRTPPFYKSSEVSHVAQLQLPLEGVLFSEELSLSGRLVLDISVSDRGKVISIEVVEASDASGALRAHMLPLLKEAPFSPAYKDGKPVNSVRRVEFTLGIVIDDPALGFKSEVSPGFRPRMDERGNILKTQPKQ